MKHTEVDNILTFPYGSWNMVEMIILRVRLYQTILKLNLQQETTVYTRSRTSACTGCARTHTYTPRGTKITAESQKWKQELWATDINYNEWIAGTLFCTFVDVQHVFNCFFHLKKKQTHKLFFLRVEKSDQEAGTRRLKMSLCGNHVCVVTVQTFS